MQEKLSLISQLIELSKVDGRVTDDEVALIKQMGNMLGLEDQQMLELFKKPVAFDPPTSPMDRITQFHRLVLLMNVDGEVSPNEIQHLKLMGIKYGLQADAVEDVLREMVKHPNGVVPPEKLIAIYTRHMN